MIVEITIFFSGVAATIYVERKFARVFRRTNAPPPVTAPQVADRPPTAALASAEYNAPPLVRTPRFEVECVDGVPGLEQFRAAVPEQVDCYRFDYSNEYDHAFAFEAVRRGFFYDVFIRAQPPYRLGQESGGHSTHRHAIGTLNVHICFAAGVEPMDLPDACRKACLWADCTSRYIVFDQPFG